MAKRSCFAILFHTINSFIKTFGCQMNEYDSDKMADVLAAAEGYEPTAGRRRRPT
jgi:tRNA A37 methylthiotransferase MiaB